MSVHIVVIIETGEQAQGPVVQLLNLLTSAVENEAGCERYEAFISGRKRVVVMEQWRDGESLRTHGEGSAYRELMSGLDGLGVPAPAIHILRPATAA